MLARFHPSPHCRLVQPRKLSWTWTGQQKRNASRWDLAPESVKATKKYPLTSWLSKLGDKGRLGGSLFDEDQISNLFKRKKRLKRYTRTQIVSPELCDDILAYMGPSLEKHRGCDILDLNPGVGLWSQKLHDFLQPRNHILFEPNPEIYGEVLEPLTKLPGSTYKLVVGDCTSFEELQKLVDDGHFPQQKRVTSKDPHDHELNPSMLVTGNVMWDPMLPGVGFDSMGKQLLWAFTKMAWNNETFHAFGPARMLLWASEDDAWNLIPKAQFETSKGGALMNMLTTTNLVVTPAHNDEMRTMNGRSARYELQSLVRAMKKGEESGMTIPAHRREDYHDIADDARKLTNETGILNWGQTYEFLKEQDTKGKSTAGFVNLRARGHWKAEKDFAANPPEMVVQETKNGAGRRLVSPAQKQLALQRASHSRMVRDKAHVDGIVDLGEDIYKLECKILEMQEGPEKEAQLAKLEEMQATFENSAEHLDSNIRSSLYTELDDRLTLNSPLTRLQWDERPYEPLASQRDEFWPKRRVFLADITPKSRPEGGNDEYIEYLQDFIFGLAFGSGCKSLPSVLNSMHHGAAELVDKVPALRDPKKGGRLNLQNMRVRLLTSEHLDGLCRAFMDWPFKDPDATSRKHFQLKSSISAPSRARG